MTNRTLEKSMSPRPPPIPGMPPMPPIPPIPPMPPIPPIPPIPGMPPIPPIPSMSPKSSLNALSASCSSSSTHFPKSVFRYGVLTFSFVRRGQYSSFFSFLRSVIENERVVRCFVDFCRGVVTRLWLNDGKDTNFRYDFLVEVKMKLVLSLCDSFSGADQNG